MLVYRIEHKNDPRRGCFRGEGFTDSNPAKSAHKVALRVGAFDPFLHPCPSTPLYTLWNHVCGLPSLDAYRTWFSHPEVRAALYDGWDYHMRVYDVPDCLVFVEMIQVVFNPDDATSVRVATPEEMA